jgi:hypothetical protein
MTANFYHEEERMRRTGPLSALAAGLVLALPLAAAVANPEMIGKVKQAGYPAQNCQYCHVSAVPKKETYKPEDLNDRGKWLAAEKTKQNAKAVSVDWLKDYPGGKDQKK